MTAAERQRKCRAGGKGRHRGGAITPGMRAEAQSRMMDVIAGAQAAAAAPPPAESDASATPPPPTQLAA